MLNKDLNYSERPGNNCLLLCSMDGTQQKPVFSHKKIRRLRAGQVPNPHVPKQRSSLTFNILQESVVDPDPELLARLDPEPQ